MTKRITVLAVLAALVLSACGTRVDRDEAEAAQLETLGGGSAAAVTPGGTASGDPAIADPASTETFGTLEIPCGPGDASGATDLGVTDDSIRIGTIADPGGLVPGLNQGIHDSMSAFVAWCNDLGGINGRALQLDLLDAKLTQYAERVAEGCEQDFALVGGGGAFDQLGAQDAVDCGLPDVAGFTVSPDKADADLTYQPVPNPPNDYNIGAARWIAEEFPEVIDKAASVWGNIPVAVRQQARHQEAYETEGFEFVYDAVTNIGEVNYGPVVNAMKSAGVEYFTFTSTWEELVTLQIAMRQQGFEPKVVDLEANFYNVDYPVVGGEAVDGSFVRIAIWPFEEADQNPATQMYLDIMEQYQPDGKVELLGVQAFSAGLLFATAVKALGSDVTRETLVAELETIDTWDGGGLHGPSNPADNIPSNCIVVMEVVDGGWQRRFPDEGLECSEDNRVELTGDYGTGARISD